MEASLTRKIGFGELTSLSAVCFAPRNGSIEVHGNRTADALTEILTDRNGLQGVGDAGPDCGYLNRVTGAKYVVTDRQRLRARRGIDHQNLVGGQNIRGPSDKIVALLKVIGGHKV